MINIKLFQLVRGLTENGFFRPKHINIQMTYDDLSTLLQETSAEREKFLKWVFQQVKVAVDSKNGKITIELTNK